MGAQSRPPGLHLDHVGAEVGKGPGAHRSGDSLRPFDDPKVGKRLNRSGSLNFAARRRAQIRRRPTRWIPDRAAP